MVRAHRREADWRRFLRLPRRLIWLAFAAALPADAAGAQQPAESGPTRLTFPRFSYPSWSPDGTKILYECCRQNVRSPTGGNWDIYVMDVRPAESGGGAVRQLTHHHAADRMPSWSPDGTQVAFVSDRDGDFDLFVINADGTGERRITDNDLPEIHPFWAAKTGRILFNRRIGGERLYDIRSIASDGTGEELLWTDDELNSYSQLSPDGSRIVFDKWVDNDDSNGEIFVLSLPEKRLTRLTDNRVYDGYPAWTPDGRIIYSSLIGEDFKLFVMNSDGTERRQLTFGPGSDARANVSPDGKTIVFNRELDDNINIYTMPFGG